MFGSIYTFDLSMNLSSPQVSVQQLNEGKQRRERIKAAGIAVLEAFYSSHKRQPDAFDAQDLLARVQAIPGCQTFDLDRLSMWFVRRRRQEKQTNIFYPTLSPESIQHLKVLSHCVEQPNEELLATWAALLKANVEDIKAWIQDNMLHNEEAPFQMPTPHNSTSPEPKHEPFQSPVLQHKECIVLTQKIDEADIKKVLLDVISAIVKEELPSSNLPCTALEFSTLFSPYEEKMERIINSLI
ncbi:hypothetical protein APHAL10511_004700 [Amanita phalloides]|nr:hypothetical protein APHAL10511_004700 [Amanita phalloides]